METVVNKHSLGACYSGKKVFVTGHTGFKGAWLTALLQHLGATVKGYALAPAYANGLFDLLPAAPPGLCVIEDIRNNKKLASEITQFQPDFIFHLAAQPLVRRSYAMPAATFEVNAIGTANLLEAVQQLPGKCTIVIITTDKVYENKEQQILYKETDRLGGFDPYSASKACTELVVSAFRNSFFNPAAYPRHQKAIATARAGNVIGGGDWSEDRIVPDIVRFLQSGNTIAVRNPAAIRPWQHVLEPLTGYLQLAALLHQDAGHYAPAYNFGPLPNDHLTVQQLVETALSCWGEGRWQATGSQQQPHEAMLLQLDISLAIKDLQWRPALTAAEAIQWTINWYKQPVAEQLAYSFEQIKNYLAI